jgi:hypothetical protein
MNDQNKNSPNDFREAINFNGHNEDYKDHFRHVEPRERETILAIDNKFQNYNYLHIPIKKIVVELF